MAIAQSLLPEFDLEMATTRRLLARVPEERADYRPHPKSFPLGDLAEHVANIPTWMNMTLGQTELEINPPGGFPPRKFEGTQRLLEKFDANVKAAREALANASDADLTAGWSLLNRGTVAFTLPRVAVVRSFVMNHGIHHRGQLTVYLRELDVPLPQMYGPTADEPM